MIRLSSPRSTSVWDSHGRTLDCRAERRRSGWHRVLIRAEFKGLLLDPNLPTMSLGMELLFPTTMRVKKRLFASQNVHLDISAAWLNASRSSSLLGLRVAASTLL